MVEGLRAMIFTMTALTSRLIMLLKNLVITTLRCSITRQRQAAVIIKLRETAAHLLRQEAIQGTGKLSWVIITGLLISLASTGM